MKKELIEVIEKILNLNGETCPVYQYEHPLLDKDVADLLARCFVKLLNDTRIDQELRYSIIKYLRNCCKHEPAGHLCVDDDIAKTLQDLYAVLLKNLNNNTLDTNKALDSFLIRNMKETHINSIYEPAVKPDILQAFANLKGSKDDMNSFIFKDIIFWNTDNSQYSGVLKTLWDPAVIADNNMKSDDLSIKNKSEIEKIILSIYEEMLTSHVIDELGEWLLEKADFEKLLQLSEISSECFQICCSIMNSLLIMTDFNSDILNFIEIFIEYVKSRCKEVYFSLLYPINLRHIVVLLDINISRVPEKDAYVESTLKHLNDLYNESESDAIMLLSHFKEWFHLYYITFSQSQTQ